MAYSKLIVPHVCLTCQCEATEEVFDEAGASAGYFCARDGTKKRAELESTRKDRDAVRERERRG